MERWQRPWGSLKLQTGLIKMIVIQVSITERVNKLAGLQVYHLRNHMHQQCVRCNVERFSGHPYLLLNRYDFHRIILHDLPCRLFTI